MKNQERENDVLLENYEIAKRVSLATILINSILALIKVIAGLVGKSSAMLADGVHTISDVATTIIVLFGIKISSRKADKSHPYGHEKFESVFAKLLSIILVLVGLMIGYKAIKLLIYKNFTTPGKSALYAAIFSIISKEIMYRYTIDAARKIKSTSMEADAWHHRSDAFSSVGTFVGILGARLGFPALDPIAGVLVSLMIIKVGVDLYLKAISELVDEAADEGVILEIKHKTLDVVGVKRINSLKTRIFGNRIYVDMDIAVDASITVREGHSIAERVHDKIEREVDAVKHCMIHVEPFE